MPRRSAHQIELPKWPAMTVTGDHITPEQAAEVIIRTNEWHHGCNDRAWRRLVWDAIGAKVTVTNGHENSDFASVEAARERLRGLRLKYLYNSRVMSSWIGGPHGWCDWSGDIHSTNYNIGKWPSVEEVRADWAAIAEAFPFLRLRCQLWSGEAGVSNIVPLIEFVVARGKVRTITPRTTLLYPKDLGDTHLADLFRMNRERGCAEETLHWAIQQTLDGQQRPTVWDRLVAEEAP